MGSFEVAFRFPLSREQEQLLHRYAASPEAVPNPADTLTFGEVTLLIDGEVVRPPWSASKRLPYSGTEWVFGFVVQFANAVIGLRDGEPQQYVRFMDDPLQIRFDRQDHDIGITVERIGGPAGEPATIAFTRTSPGRLLQEARLVLNRLIETLSAVDTRIIQRPPFKELGGLLADLRG